MSFALTVGQATAIRAAAGTTLAFTTFAAVIPIGRLLVVGVCGDIASMTFTGADNSSQSGAPNIYNALTPVGGTLLTGGILWCIVTRQIQTTDTVTITSSSSTTRAAGVMTFYTVSNGDARIDKQQTVSNATASPLNTALSGTLTTTTDVQLGFHFWKGGAVASGFSVQAGFAGTGANALSGGTTTRVEAHSTESVLGNNNTDTWGSGYTSITAACLHGLTFADFIPTWRRIKTVSRTQAGR